MAGRTQLPVQGRCWGELRLVTIPGKCLPKERRIPGRPRVAHHLKGGGDVRQGARAIGADLAAYSGPCEQGEAFDDTGSEHCPVGWLYGLWGYPV